MIMRYNPFMEGLAKKVLLYRAMRLCYTLSWEPLTAEPISVKYPSIEYSKPIARCIGYSIRKTMSIDVLWIEYKKGVRGGASAGATSFFSLPYKRRRRPV